MAIPTLSYKSITLKYTNTIKNMTKKVNTKILNANMAKEISKIIPDLNITMEERALIIIMS